jgi:ribosomal protein L40E
MEIAVMLALVGATAAIILTPLRTRLPEPGSDAPAPVRSGTDAADALADLEFDHATGKLDDDDYAALRADVETARAAEAAHPAPAGRATPALRTLDALEAEILALRRKQQVCTACGTALPKAARFCPDCGTPVAARP